MSKLFKKDVPQCDPRLNSSIRRVTSVYMPESKTVYRIGHKVIGASLPIERLDVSGEAPVIICGYDRNDELVMKIITNDTVIITYDDSDRTPDFSLKDTING